MKNVRIILFSPLAALRLLLVFCTTVVIGISGFLWYLIFGFSRELQKWSLHLWGKSILLICGISVKKGEIPEATRFILMPNHRSYLDIFIFAAYTPAAFIAKAELKNWPMMRIASKITGMIFVSRSKLNSLISTIYKIKESVDRGIPVIVFPEGTTSQGPLTLPFKKGSFHIVSETGIPVIPAAIHYKDAADAWIGEDTFLGHFFRQMGKPVTKVCLRYGDPITDVDAKKLLTKVKKSIDGMLQQMAL